MVTTMTTVNSLSDSQRELPYVVVNSSMHALPTLSYMIGIAASNEEQNIGTLLDNLVDSCPPEVEAICVVSSGSTDKTNDIVKAHAQRDARIQLIIEPERNGKASALNILLSESEKYGYMIYMGGDNIPCKGAIVNLLANIEEGDADIVGARPIPVNDSKTFSGFCCHLLWNLHHTSSLKSPKISGELMAFRTRIVRELPPAIINDDAYIQSLGEMKRCKIAYSSDAEVLLKGPSTVTDFITQRKRVFIGHKQLEFLIGKKISTMKMPKWKDILNACPYRGVKGRTYAVGFILLQGVSFLFAKWDFARHRLPFKWKMVKTTKNLQEVSEAALLSKIQPLKMEPQS
jgi:poly-beta-1,6-N-acetyl-D-glucosamine synthase